MSVNNRTSVVANGGAKALATHYSAPKNSTCLSMNELGKLQYMQYFVDGVLLFFMILLTTKITMITRKKKTNRMQGSI